MPFNPLKQLAWCVAGRLVECRLSHRPGRVRRLETDTPKVIVEPSSKELGYQRRIIDVAKGWDGAEAVPDRCHSPLLEHDPCHRQAGQDAQCPLGPFAQDE